MRTELHVCHTEGAYTPTGACPRTRLPPTALQPWSARRRRGERVQKAGTIGGGAALSTRGAAPGRCDDACRTYRHHTSTVEGFEVCLRGRRRLALDRAGRRSVRAWRRQACAARTGGTGRTRAARDGGGGTSCPGARAQLCARAPSPANAACAQQINPRPRPVGQVHGLGLAVRAGGSARAVRQSSTSTPPPRASAPPPTVRALPSSLKFGDGRKSRSSYPVRCTYPK